MKINDFFFEWLRGSNLTNNQIITTRAAEAKKKTTYKNNLSIYERYMHNPKIIMLLICKQRVVLTRVNYCYFTAKYFENLHNNNSKLNNGNKIIKVVKKKTKI